MNGHCGRSRARRRSGADVRGLNRPRFARSSNTEIDGEVRFDKVSRALYSTDASVYQIEPIGVVIPRSRDDLIRLVAYLCGATVVR